MDVTRTEEEQIEALKKWWSENGWAIVGGIVIGLAGVFGWRAWQAHQIAIAQQASDIYAQLIVNVRTDKNDQARTQAKKLLDEYPNTSYATFASLILGKLDVENNDLDSARQHLQWVIDNTDQNELKHLARIRLARVLLSSDKPEDALKLIENIDQGKFAASYDEVKGDIFVKLDKPEEARKAYQSALALSTDKGQSDSFLEMKLDNLGQSNP